MPRTLLGVQRAVRVLLVKLVCSEESDRLGLCVCKRCRSLDSLRSLGIRATARMTRIATRALIVIAEKLEQRGVEVPLVLDRGDVAGHRQHLQSRAGNESREVLALRRSG